jgi:hypothetical protein
MLEFETKLKTKHLLVCSGADDRCWQRTGRDRGIATPSSTMARKERDGRQNNYVQLLLMTSRLFQTLLIVKNAIRVFHQFSLGTGSQCLSESMIPFLVYGEVRLCHRIPRATHPQFQGLRKHQLQHTCTVVQLSTGMQFVDVSQTYSS